MEERSSVDSMALVRAAKVICDLKSGLCPINEAGFSGCPFVCGEDTRPWQCWVVYLRAGVEQGVTEEEARRMGLVA